MLDYEQQIKQDGDIPQQELQWVPRHAAPVLLEGRVQNQLPNRQHTPGKVKQNLPDIPPNGGLAFVVNPCLGHVFDNRDDELHVGDSIELPGPGQQSPYFPVLVGHVQHQSTPRRTGRVHHPDF